METSQMYYLMSKSEWKPRPITEEEAFQFVRSISEQPERLVRDLRKGVYIGYGKQVVFKRSEVRSEQLKLSL